MNFEVINLKKDVRKVIVDSICFYNQIKKDNLFVFKRIGIDKQDDFLNLTPVEKKELALFMGLLNSDNKVSRSLKRRGITKYHVFNYLGYDDIKVKETDFRRLEMQFEMLNFIDYLNVREEELSVELLAHLIYSSSINILPNLYYAEITKERRYYNTDKMRFKEFYETGKMARVSLLGKIKGKYNYKIK